MTMFEKTVQIITIIVAIGAFLWGIVSVFILHFQNKKIAKLQSRLECGNHISRTVFDKIFNVLQETSVAMFECYNCAGRQMFPYYRDAIESNENPRYDIDKMSEACDKAKSFLNTLIETTQLNRFIIPTNILEQLESFEISMKIIMNGYSAKMVELDKFEDEQLMMKRAEQLQYDYQEFTSNCREYIDSLQIL